MRGGLLFENSEIQALYKRNRRSKAILQPRRPAVRPRRALGARRRRLSALCHSIMDITDIGRECIQPTQVNQALISAAIDIATCVLATTCSHYISDQLEVIGLSHTPDSSIFRFQPRLDQTANCQSQSRPLPLL